MAGRSHYFFRRAAPLEGAAARADGHFRPMLVNCVQAWPARPLFGKPLDQFLELAGAVRAAAHPGQRHTFAVHRIGSLVVVGILLEHRVVLANRIGRSRPATRGSRRCNTARSARARCYRTSSGNPNTPAAPDPSCRRCGRDWHCCRGRVAEMVGRFRRRGRRPAARRRRERPARLTGARGRGRGRRHHLHRVAQIGQLGLHLGHRGR